MVLYENIQEYLRKLPPSLQGCHPDRSGAGADHLSGRFPLRQHHHGQNGPQS